MVTKGLRVKLRLREVRKAKGISQTTIARVIGKTSGAVWKYEFNFVPILAEDLHKIAQFLGVTMDELVEREAEDGDRAALLLEEVSHA
jgi:transcriptional regulator with XRE-family HTH domain